MGVKEEKARQSCWCWTKTGRQLAPVKPTRCHKMFDESTAFSKRLTSCETQVQGLKKATDALLAISEKTLTQPLPSTWDNTADGSGVQAVAGTGAPLVKPGQLQRSRSMELKQKVYDPMTAWQKDYQRMKTRMAELDRQALRLDEARRMHYKGAQKHLQENVMKQDNVSMRSIAEGENPELVAARNGFQKLETEVHAELQQLALRARGVQGYLANAMQLQAETLSSAATTYSQPAFGGQTAGGPTGATGQMHAPGGVPAM